MTSCDTMSRVVIGRESAARSARSPVRRQQCRSRALVRTRHCDVIDILPRIFLKPRARQTLRRPDMSVKAFALRQSRYQSGPVGSSSARAGRVESDSRRVDSPTGAADTCARDHSPPPYLRRRRMLSRALPLPAWRGIPTRPQQREHQPSASARHHHTAVCAAGAAAARASSRLSMLKAGTPGGMKAGLRTRAKK